jgi:hypothetical protein
MKIRITLNKEKVFNGNMKKPGTVLLTGDVADGIEPFKVIHAIKLGEVDIDYEEKKEKSKDK